MEYKKVGEKEQKKIPASMRIGLIIFLALGFVLIGAFWMKYNDQKRINDELEKEVAAWNERVAQKEEELAAPFDDYYVARIARRELGYGLPGEILFRSDFEQ